MAAALGGFWRTRGWLGEGRDWFKRLLNLPIGPRQTPVRAKALQGAGSIAYYHGDHSAAAALLVDSVALWRELADPAGLAHALDIQGLVDWARAELESAAGALTASLQLARQLRLRSLEARNLYHLGLVAYDSGDFAAAQDWHSQSMALAQELRDMLYQARAYYGLGQVARQRGDLAHARALHEAGLACRRAAGERWGMALALVGLGQVSVDEGDLAGASDLFAQSLMLSNEQGDRHGLARALEGMAAVAAHGEPERAARLAGAAAALREAAGAPLPPTEAELFDRRLAPVRAALGDLRSCALVAEAKAMPLDEVVRLASAAPIHGSFGAESANVDSLLALTKRETEVLELISSGKSNTEIADELVVSVRTVERHITNLYAKIGARNKADATAYAFRHHLS